MSHLKEGDRAPAIHLTASSGEKVKLSDFKGKKRVVLYFYPKDDTPGCTVESCGFRDSHKKIENQNAVILGISPDGIESHHKFIEKFNLPFILLSDEEKKTCQDYGVWIEKNMYGKKYWGVARTTFIVGKDGKIEKIYEKVKSEGHAEEVVDFLRKA
ncbi:MAG: thioredoxin-dependent thiol peroxidase [Deltaproteobacteria bacterium]|nr:thioredoxin-dependent thiol peroxidase [Deltaproteobacteria bacterium]